MELVGELEGRWHIVATTFPMWLSGKRLDPTFTSTRRGDVHDAITRVTAPDDAMWRAIDEDLARRGRTGVQRLTPSAV
ncbi:MAG: hypothetical protein ABIW49_11970 [Knoellia sp.]